MLMRVKGFTDIDLLGGLIGKVDGRSQRGKEDIPESGFTPDWIITYALDSTIRSCLSELKILKGLP